MRERSERKRKEHKKSLKERETVCERKLEEEGEKGKKEIGEIMVEEKGRREGHHHYKL